MDTSRARILVVDADSATRELVQSALADRADVVGAATATEGLSRLEGRPVDVCLCDQAVVGASGDELFRLLREKNPRMTRIMTGGLRESGALLAAQSRGLVDRFLTKPLNAELVRSAVGEFLGSSPVKARADTVLVIDDDPVVRTMVSTMLKQAGFDVLTANDGRQALELIRERGTSLAAAVCDLDMPHVSGLEVVSQARTLAPELPAVVLSGHTDHHVALDCTTCGAFDFMAKPVTQQELLFRVKRAVTEARRRRELETYRTAAAAASSGIVAESPGMTRVLAQARSLAASDATVLITGETGVGKDAVAREIHRLSRRSSEVFLGVNCGALTETLLESELFGHEKGAFTGAVGRRIGLFEMADGGTLFLDEVGEMTPATQVKLLRVLETREFTRVGGTQRVQVDVRLVAATHRQLESMVQEGKFRQDLYFRLFILPLHIPPLRERPEDIPALLRFALGRVRGSRQLFLSPGAFTEASLYHWPGNVRELLNRVERAAALSSGDVIESLDLPVTAPSVSTPAAPAAESVHGPLTGRPLKEVVGEVVGSTERRYLSQLLEETHGNLAEAAKRAGVDRKSIYNKMKAYGLDKHAFKRRLSGDEPLLEPEEPAA